jgi:nucleotide-binding universal stress UspA family protein
MAIITAVDEKRNPEKIIKTGYELATAFDEELQVLHVIPEQNAEEHFEEIREIDQFNNVSLTAEIDRAEEIAATLTEEVLGDFSTEEVNPIGRIGNPTDEILAASESTDARYLVIGGRKRSPVGKATFGSVTQSIILNSNLPTVTVMTDN